MSNFWDLIWLIFSAFMFVAYLLVLFQVVSDLFRDNELGGGAKALWLIFLVFLPILSVLVYVIARGQGMSARQNAALQKSKSETDAFFKRVATKSPAEQITEAKTLLDADAINQDEYAELKAKALA